VSSELIAYPSLEGSECPFPYYEMLRREAPVHQIPDRPHLFMVSRLADVRHVLAHPEIFSARGCRAGLMGAPFLIAGADAPIMTDLDDPEHKEKREIAFAPLKPGRLATYEPLVREIADELIDGFIADGHTDFAASFARPLPVSVMCRMLDLPREDEEWVRSWGSFETAGLPWMPDDFRAAQTAKTEGMHDYLTKMLEERHAHPGKDIMSVVIAEQVERHGEFRLSELRPIVAALLGGGVVTTAHFLSSALLLLLEHPDQLAKLRGNPALVKRAIEECLRLEAPTQWIPRLVIADTELSGVAIPAGAVVILSIGAANRDDRFADADALDVERPNATDHVSWGHGTHFCLGAPLARLEVQVAFEVLFERLDDLRVAPGVELTHLRSPQFRGLNALPIEFTERR
jgi:cytochrome P450